MSDLFGCFLLALRFSATNSGIKNSDDVPWKVWTKVVRPKKYFQKKNYKKEILNHLYFGPSFVFWRTALGRFSQCVFLIFRPWSTMVTEIFTQPPLSHHKKASYGPVLSEADLELPQHLLIEIFTLIVNGNKWMVVAIKRIPSNMLPGR